MNKIINQIIKKNLFSLRSTGNSMRLLLLPNDILYYKKNFRKISVNDLVLVKTEVKLFTHRVIYKTKKYLVTKGDNNIESDGKIYLKQILGKVYQIKRNGQTINPNDLYLIQSTLYFREIIKIKQAFEKEKIDYVILKGLPLHLYFEKLHPKRIYADCDVLIKKEHFFKAKRMIKKFGYRKTDEKNKQVENNYFKNINGFTVVFDVHLEPAFLMTQFSGLEALYPQKLIDQLTVDLLNNKRPIKINGEKFFILNSKFLILYLALHLFHHNFRGAFRYQFLDTVIRRSLDSRFRGNDKGIDWQNIKLTINKYQLTNFVYPVLMLIKKYYQSPIPKSFLKTIRPSRSYISSMIYHQRSIFNDEPRIGAGMNRFKNIFFLSPQPLWRKLTVFFHPQVIYFISLILKKKLSSFFSSRRADPANLS